MDYTRSAKSAVKTGEYAAATESLHSVKRIVEGDIELLNSEAGSATHRDILALERKLLGETIAALGVMPGDNIQFPDSAFGGNDDGDFQDGTDPELAS